MQTDLSELAKPANEQNVLLPRLLGKVDVRLRIGVKGKSTLDDMIRRGEFPKPNAYMYRKPFWTLEAVDKWVDALIAKSAGQEVHGTANQTQS